MNSEKVKKIKKALEDNANYEHYDKLSYIDGYKCKTVDFADILTLINELEEEVETRKEEVLHLQEYGRKLIRETELKRFAERLKEKALSHCRTINCYELTFIETTIDELLKEYEK